MVNQLCSILELRIVNKRIRLEPESKQLGGADTGIEVAASAPKIDV
jgi:hypothetical protein